MKEPTSFGVFDLKPPTEDVWKLHMTTRTFKICYKRMDARSLADIKEFGVRVSGIPRFDKEIKNELVTSARVTIARMLEYRQRGVAFHVNKKVDLLHIYDVLTTFINDSLWKKYRTINGATEVDVDKLQAAQSLRADIYNVVKFDLALQQAKPELDLEGYATLPVTGNFFDAPELVPTADLIEKAKAQEAPDEFGVILGDALAKLIETSRRDF